MFSYEDRIMSLSYELVYFSNTLTEHFPIISIKARDLKGTQLVKFVSDELNFDIEGLDLTNENVVRSITELMIQESAIREEDGIDG